MKKIFLILILISSNHSFGLTEKEISKMTEDMSAFAERKNLTDKDIPEITQQLKNVLILEDADKSRQGTFELSQSYPYHKALYQKALKAFKKSEQKDLQKILDMVDSLHKNGNG